MIIVAIRSQPQNVNGVSRTLIAKYLKSEFQYDKALPLKNALKKAVEKKKLVQNGQSFRVVGDVVPEVAQEPQIQIKEIKEGSNAATGAAQDGDTVVVKYEGKLEDGTIFDSASSFEFTLGAGEVIKGWDLGVKGMKVGGKRKLFVPAKLGYGKRGAMPEIPPNADLYFKITLKDIKNEY
jgi:FKBP-type peptidyl-prolyl cis-trans isomerase